MNILTLETKALSAIEHGAAWLVGLAANATTALNELNPGSSVVAQAVTIGLEAAAGHGLNVQPIENAGAAVLDAARDLQAQLMHTAGKPPVPVEDQSPPAPPAASQDTPADDSADAAADDTADGTDDGTGKSAKSKSTKKA